MKKILVLGGGTAGSIVANKLARELRREIALDKIQITLLDKSPTSQNQAGFTFVPFGYLTKQDLFRDKKKMISPRVRCFFGRNGTIKKIKLNEKTVITESGENHHYDYLVIATGCQADTKSIEGLSENFNSFYTSFEDALNLGEKVSKIKTGNVVILAPSMPIPCPGASGKFAIMLNDYLKYVRKIESDIQIHLLWPSKSIGPPSYHSVVQDSFLEKGISLHASFHLDRVNEEKNKVMGTNGDELEYDLLVVAPPHKTITPLRNSEITNELGWIPTKKSTLQLEEHDEVYAIGDNGDPEIPKTGIAAHYQSLITAQNIINEINGINIKVDYRGEAGCPFIGSSYTPHSKGKAYIPIWTYDKPPDPFPATELGWMFYRLYYYMHWDTTIKGLM